MITPEDDLERELPADLRVTPRVPPWLVFGLRLLLVLAISALVIGLIAASVTLEGAWIRWQAQR